MAEPLIIEIDYDDSKAIKGLKRLDQSMQAVSDKGRVLEHSLTRVDQVMAGLQQHQEQAIQGLASKTLAGLDAIEKQWKQNTSATDAAAKATDKATESLKKTTTQATKTESTMRDLWRSGQAVAGIFGVTLSVGAMVGFARSTAEAASRIVDLSNQLEVSIEYAQRLKFASDQTRTSIDTFGRSMFTLTTNLAEGGRQVDQALARIGQTRQTIGRLSQEQQIDTVIRGLAHLTDVGARNRAGNALLGMSYRELAKNIREMPGIMDAAAIAREADVKRVDAAQKRVDSALSALSALGIESFAGALQGGGFAAAARARDARRAAATTVIGPQLTPGIPPNIPQEIENYRRVVSQADAEVRRLSTSQRANIDAGLALGTSMADLAKMYHLSAEAAIRYATVTGEMKKAQDEAAERTKHFGDVIHDAASAQILRDLDALKHPILTLARATATADDAMQSFYDTVRLRPAQVETLGFLPGVSGDTWDRMFAAVDQWKRDIPVVGQSTRRWADGLSDVANEFARLAQISDGSLSQVVRGVGSAISLVSQLDRAIQQIETTGRASLGNITSLLTGPAAFAGLFPDEGFLRNKPKQMSDNIGFLTHAVNELYGSFDALHTKLRDLGATGEHLWQQVMSPRHVVSETQKFLDLIDQELDKLETGRALFTDVIRESLFEADQAGRTGVDAVLASLEHQKEAELRALQQYAATDAALYQRAVEAVTNKYTALAAKAIRDDAQSQVDELTRISGLLDGIKRHTDTEIASLGQFSSAGAFYDAVIARIRGRQSAIELSQLGRAGQIVGGGTTLAVSVGDVIVQAQQNDPFLAQRLGEAILQDVARKGQRVS